MGDPAVVILGAGLAGSCAALEMARRGLPVTLLDQAPRPVAGASMHNEGKLHHGFIYAADPHSLAYKVMIEGSLQFLPLVESLTRVDRRRFGLSEPFIYVVPEDSHLSTLDIERHFSQVDRYGLIRRVELDSDTPWAEVYELSDVERTQLFSPRVVKAYQTSEVGVDPYHLANVTAAAVLAHPLITFRPHHRVTSADRRAHGGYRVHVRVDDASRVIEADGVINALWEARPFIDEQVGIEIEPDISWRWKATVTIEGRLEHRVPAVTALVGPFGDVVDYGTDRTYVSWYPVCNQGMTNRKGLDPLAHERDALVPESVRDESLAAMSSLVPSIAALPNLSRRCTIGGGYILATGTSDIDDPVSGLHQRHQIGPHLVDQWCSLRTGKFCTAPLFGVQAAHGMTERMEIN